MKKVFVGLILYILYSSLFSNGYFSREFGFLDGEIVEYVVDSNCTNTDNLESRLNWDLSKIPYFVFSDTFFFNHDFYWNFDFLIGIPGRSGNMQDYDWLNCFYWRRDDPTELTNYSISENYLTRLFSINLRLGKKIISLENFEFCLYEQFEVSHFFFASLNGYKTYKSDDWKKIPLEGNVISYTQNILMPYLGFDILLSPVTNLKLNWALEICPFLGMINAFDYHFINQSDGGTLYLDEPRKVFSINSTIKLSYSFCKKNNIGVKIKFANTPISLGKDYSKKMNKAGQIISPKWGYAGDSLLAGTSNLISSVSFVYCYEFN